MKVMIDGVLYVQKNSIDTMLRIGEEIPVELYEEIFGDDDGCFYVSGIMDGYRFVPFGESESIEFWMAQDYVLNWNEYKNISIEELEKIALYLRDLRNNKVIEFNAQSPEYREENFDEFGVEIFKDEAKIEDLFRIIELLSGKIAFEIPGETEPVDVGGTVYEHGSETVHQDVVTATIGPGEGNARHGRSGNCTVTRKKASRKQEIERIRTNLMNQIFGTGRK